MNEDELRQEREAVIEAMQKDLANAPRSMYEMIPVLANRWMNATDLNEAIFGLDDTYYTREVKLYFTYFCGRGVERAYWVHEMDIMNRKAEEIIDKIMVKLDSIERHIGIVEHQHDEIMEKSDQLLAEARQVAGTQTRK